MRLSKIIAFPIIFSILVQSLGLVSPVLAETVGTVEMGYTDPDHIHAPKVVDGVEYQYDANGNLVNDGERVISWNQDNLPTKIVKDGQVVEFFYDANGNRIVKKSGGTKTTYPSPYLTIQQFNNSTISKRYYFAGGKRIAFRSEQTPLTFLHQDHLGSTVLATNNQSQPVSESLTYFPYGSSVNNLTIQQFNHSSHLFTGQELDPESDLYNYNARLYNPTTGAFISADTVGGGNRYSYAANNPLLFTDPTGHMLDAGDGGGGGGRPYLPLITKDWSGGGSPSLGERIDNFVADDTGNLTPGWEWLNYTKLINPFFYFDKFVEQPVVEATGISPSLTIGTVGTLGGLAYGGAQWFSFAKDYYYYNYFYSAAPKPAERVLETGSVSWSSGGLGNREWLQKWYEDTHGVEFEVVDDAILVAGDEVHSGQAVVGSRHVQLARNQIDTGVLRHEAGHAIAEGGQVPAVDSWSQFYANECIQCQHTYDWLLAAGYPQNHPYIQKELWYWQSNWQAYLEAVKTGR